MGHYQPAPRGPAGRGDPIRVRRRRRLDIQPPR